MKKYFLIICIAFIPVSIQAQWSLGGKAGINWSTINYPWSKLGDHADYLSGFQGGIIATYQFNNYFSDGFGKTQCITGVYEYSEVKFVT